MGISAVEYVNISNVFKIPVITGGGRWKKLIGPEITEDDKKLQAGHRASFSKVVSLWNKLMNRVRDRNMKRKNRLKYFFLLCLITLIR
jgi:hypothetical protein